jgi:putative spermidine/putrescine transport system substrate-binding protein
MKVSKVLKLIAVIMLFCGITTVVFSKDVTVKKPVKLSIIDVAGNLRLSKPAIEAFKAANPKLVANIEYIQLTAPEVTSKIKAQQMAKNLDTTLVLTGGDGLAFGMKEKIWEQIMPKYKDFFPNVLKDYLPGAKAAYDLYGGFGLTYVFCPAGPIVTYDPSKVKNPPKTPAELLEWAKANPGKFMYARPGNSGPARVFLMGLPFILGDKDPKDPKTWDKTWAYLKELDQYIDYYPSGTAITFKELAEGTRWMIASHIGWDMNQRILATIPADFQAAFFDKTTLVNDAQFFAIPKGLDGDRLNVTLALMEWLMKPVQQAVTYDEGYFYPGPAIANVPISMAPKASQDKVIPAMRDYFDKAIKTLPNTTSLTPEALALASDTWDKMVGSKIKK